MAGLLDRKPSPWNKRKTVDVFHRDYRFTKSEGGEGATPVHQCVLKRSPGSLLAARFIVYRFPDLVVDPYGKGPYRGEHLLHMCIVTKEREFILFVERHVPGGFRMLQHLGRTPHYSKPNFVELRHLVSDVRQKILEEHQQEEGQPVDGEFFDIGRSCYYGGYALSFVRALDPPPVLPRQVPHAGCWRLPSPRGGSRL